MKILAFLDSTPGGDWPPLLGLVATLRRRGDEVHAACDMALKDAVRGAGCNVVEMPRELSLDRCLQPALQAMFAGERLPSADDAGPLPAWGKGVAVAACDLLARRKFDLVLSTLFCQEAAREAARMLRRPWALINPSFFFGDRFRSPCPEDFCPLGFLLYRHWLLPPLRQADLVLHATDPVFDGAKSLPRGHAYLGPLFWEMEEDLPKVLDSPGPVWLLLSLSTSPQRDDTQILEHAALALGGMDCRVLVTLASPGRDLTSSRLPDNFFVCGYVPHSLLLPRCRLAISHGGHGLVVKAMAHGVPQLLIPWGRDQPGVASRAAALGVAMILSPQSLHGPGMTKRLRDLFVDPEYLANSRSHSRRLAGASLLPGALQRLTAIGCRR